MQFCVPNNMEAEEVFSEPKDPEIVISDGFDRWLLRNKISLAFTEKLRGKIYCVGIAGNQGAVSVTKVPVPGASALYSDGRKLWFSSNNHLHGFLKIPTEKGSRFAPIMTIATGPRGIEAIELDPEGRPVYVAAKDNALATVDFSSPFKKIWQPIFVAKDEPNDCCHLSGMALDGNEVRYVTSFSDTSTRLGWESNFNKAGKVIDITDDRVVSSGLTLPCSPVLYRNSVWLLNSGTSEFGYVDIKSGEFSSVFRTPGYPTALAFFENYAFITLSTSIAGIKPPSEDFSDDLQPSGLIVYNLDKACIVHWIRLGFESAEVNSIALLPDTPMPISIPMRSQNSPVV
ncbi:MAG: DUF4915 domain-containing protein [Magnetococcales bacterium]|nr:DUF4915 domain-containing protein [Magnetococcales bacterium]